MKARAVIIGIDEWERYTLPLIQSIQQHEPDCEIIVIDNASETPYPEVIGVTTRRVEKRLCYAAAINAGALGDWDYLIALSNDVLCSAPFIDQLKAMPPGTMGGPAQAHIIHYDYIAGWCMVIPRLTWQTVGMFDENYQVSAWEDTDYSYRVQDAGLRLLLMRDFPFYHLDQRQRHKLYDISAVHIWNGAYFERKHHIPRPLRRYTPGTLVERGYA